MSQVEKQLEKQAVSLRRSRQGELLLSFDLAAMKQVILAVVWRWLLLVPFRLYQFVLLSLERTTGKRVWLMMVTGLGLGVGIALGVFGQPAQVSAIPSVLVQSLGVKVREVKSVELDLHLVLRQTSELCQQTQLTSAASYVTSSAGIGQSGAVVICSATPRSLETLWQAKLGQEIQVIGDNNGLYRYRVTEIKALKPESLSSALSLSQETLVLYTFNTLRTEAIVVLARPTR